MSASHRSFLKTTLVATAAAACLAPAGAMAASVSISGTQVGTSSYHVFEINKDYLFTQADIQQGISVTGSVNVDIPNSNSSAFVGLIAKSQYDAWIDAGFSETDTFFGFLDTAYTGFNTAGGGGGGRLGLGQHLPSGDISQSYVAQGVGTNFSGFEILFEETQMHLFYGASSQTQAYVDGLNRLVATHGGPVTTPCPPTGPKAPTSSPAPTSMVPVRSTSTSPPTSSPSPPQPGAA